MPDPINVMLINSGVKPNILINPGALEKVLPIKRWFNTCAFSIFIKGVSL